MLKRYKNKVYTNKLAILVQRLVFNTYYKLGLGALLVVVGGILASIVGENSTLYDTFFMVHVVGWGIVTVIAIIAFLVMIYQLLKIFGKKLRKWFT